jgi:GTP-binding protein
VGVRVNSAEFVLSARSPSDFVRDGRPEVAFAGRSNVGKSCLLNCLLGRRGLARTSRTPGRTQAINYFLINGQFYFVDLPGYGYAKASFRERQRWATLMERYLRHALPAAELVLLVDAKVGATDLDVQAAGYLEEKGARPIVVATKIDRVPRNRRRAALEQVRTVLSLAEGQAPLGVSARSGEGVRALWRTITARIP